MNFMEPTTLGQRGRTAAVMLTVIHGLCDSGSSEKAHTPNAGDATKPSVPTGDHIELTRYNAVIDAIKIPTNTLDLKQGRKIVEWVDKQSVQTKPLPAERVEELSSQVGAFAQTIESLRKMHAETPDRAKKEFGPMGGGMVSYLENGNRFLIAAKDTLRTGREGKPLPTPFAAKIQGMTPYDGLGYTFNALVETSNRLNN